MKTLTSLDLTALSTGLHLADASLWLIVAMTLAVFDVSTCIENGIEIIPEIDPSPEMLR